MNPRSRASELLLPLIAIAVSSCGGGGTSPAADGNGGSSSSSGGSAIAVTASPQSETVIEGQSATFQVAASSDAPLHYQWQVNGVDVDGATGTSFTTAVQTPSDDGSQISVELSNGSTSASAGPAVLHVYAETAVPAPTQYVVDPAVTDASIDDSYGMHYAYFNPAVTPKGKLFVFFPGTGAQPRDYLLIVTAAANNGYHALGLAYQNSSLVTLPCAATGDLNCPGDVHEATFTGAATSSLVSVSPADSVENRLVKALAWLSAQHPQQNWGQYLDGSGNVIWSSVRVAGHSQGGSLSAYIGKRVAVDRASFLSAPDDEVGGEAATWLTASGQTDTTRYFGFAHTNDALIPFSVIQQTWPALQLPQFGTYTAVDGVAAPFGGSHMLDSSLGSTTLVTPLTYHDITVVDVTTPTDSNGLPTYRHVWQYLCFQ
jgi:hypothetical protein